MFISPLIFYIILKGYIYFNKDILINPNLTKSKSKETNKGSKRIPNTEENSSGPGPDTGTGTDTGIGTGRGLGTGNGTGIAQSEND